MNSAPHLLTEDRPQFERLLDQALRAMSAAPPTSAPARRFNTEQLRTMALDASPAISACASTEYAAFLRLRERDRAARAAARAHSHEEDHPDSPPPGGPAPGVAQAVSGAGLFPMMAVLTPVLASVASVIFLVTGYALSAMRPAPEIAGQLRTAGWTFLALAGLAVLIGTIGMLLTAVRDGSSAIHASDPAVTDEVSAACEAWSAALLERGLLPFLHEALASDGTEPGPPVLGGSGAGRSAAPSARPHARSDFGYSRPGFSSPDFTRRDSTAPDFTGRDHAGPAAPDSAHGQDGRRA